MKVGVLGAGTMGHGIAQVSAMAGHDVILRDIERGIRRERAREHRANLQGGVERDKVTETENDETLDRISGTTDLEAAVADADLVVEAVPEDGNQKQDVSTTSRVTSRTTASSPVQHLLAVGYGHRQRARRPAAGRRTPLFQPGPHHGAGRNRRRRTDERGDARFRRGVRRRCRQDGRRRRGLARLRHLATRRRARRRSDPHGAGRCRQSPATSTRRWNSATTTRWVPSNSATWSAWTFASTSSNTSARNSASGSARRRFSAEKVRAGKLGKKTGEGFYVWEDGEIVGVSGEAKLVGRLTRLDETARSSTPRPVAPNRSHAECERSIST